MSTENRVEAAKAELARAREEARKRTKNLRTKTSGGKRNPYVKDFSGKDFKEDTPYYIALLSLVPIVGACHWFSADEDVSDKGERFNAPRRCTANLRDDLSYGKNPDVCPACWLGMYEAEYYAQNNVMPEGYIPVDCYKGKPNGPQYLIYYYAMVAEGETVYERDADGNRKKTVELKWWDDPVALAVKPSINQIIDEHLNNLEENDGDVRTYLWQFKKKNSSGYDKYTETAPLTKGGKLVSVPKRIIENREKLLGILPSPEELLKPVSATEMADLLNLKDWAETKNTAVVSTPKDSVKVTTDDTEMVTDANEPPFETSEQEEEVLDVGAEDEADLGELGDLDGLGDLN